MVIALVGDSDPQLEALLRRCGARIEPFADVDALHAARAAVTAILLDVRRTRTLPPALAAARQQLPSVPVVLIAAGLDPALMLDAMRAGVSEYVSDASNADELQAALKRVAAPSGSSSTGDVIAFIGAKGGVGTTTLAVNMAAALAGNSSTLLIDLHMTGGDAAVFLGEETRFTVADALEKSDRLDQALFRTLAARTKSGVDLLAGADRPPGTTVEANRVALLLRFASTHYRHTIVDLPRTDAAVLAAAEAATRIVLVANQDLVAMRGAVRTAAWLRQRYRSDKTSVVVTRFDGRADIGQDELARLVGLPVSHVLPNDYRSALDALNRGRPLVGDGSKLAAALRRFARELTGTQDTPDATNVRRASVAGGLFRRTAARTT